MYCKECLEKDKNLLNNQSNVANNNFSNVNTNIFCNTCGHLIENEMNGCTFCGNNIDNLIQKKENHKIPVFINNISNIVFVIGLCISIYMVFRFFASSSSDSTRGLFIVLAIVNVLFSFMAKSFVWIVYFIFKLFLDFLKKIF